MVSTERSSTVSGGGLARALLLGGALAGPFYLVVGLAQALTRPGFDITRHDLSVLANGDLGWIQIGNFLVTGLLVLAGAAGMRRALRGGRAGTWGPALVAVYGVGLIAAGVFIADPVAGSPPGTTSGEVSFSWHGTLHLLCAAAGFFALIAACALLARRFAGRGEMAWAAFSAVAGAGFLAGFLGLALVQGSTRGTSAAPAVLGFWLALALVWSWMTALSVRLLREEGR